MYLSVWFEVPVRRMSRHRYRVAQFAQDLFPEGPKRRAAQKELVMKSVFDPSFKYTPSLNTDLRKTFERVRRERRQLRLRAPVVESRPETKLEVRSLHQFTKVSRPRA